MSIAVYFETPNHSYSEIAAIFDTEAEYNANTTSLSKEARKHGFVITEDFDFEDPNEVFSLNPMKKIMIKDGVPIEPLEDVWDYSLGQQQIAGRGKTSTITSFLDLRSI